MSSDRPARNAMVGAPGIIKNPRSPLVVVRHPLSSSMRSDFEHWPMRCCSCGGVRRTLNQPRRPLGPPRTTTVALEPSSASSHRRRRDRHRYARPRDREESSAERAIGPIGVACHRTAPGRRPTSTRRRSSRPSVPAGRSVHYSRARRAMRTSRTCSVSAAVPPRRSRSAWANRPHARLTLPGPMRRACCIAFLTG